MGKLFPWLDLQMSSLVDIEDISEQDIPDKPGVYVLSGNAEYPYPWSKEWGKSNIFYIGRASSLRKRIRDHKKHCDDIRSGNPKYEYYYPIYEYAITIMAKSVGRLVIALKLQRRPSVHF